MKRRLLVSMVLVSALSLSSVALAQSGSSAVPQGHRSGVGSQRPDVDRQQGLVPQQSDPERPPEVEIGRNPDLDVNPENEQRDIERELGVKRRHVGEGQQPGRGQGSGRGGQRPSGKGGSMGSRGDV